MSACVWCGATLSRGATICARCGHAVPAPQARRADRRWRMAFLGALLVILLLLGALAWILAGALKPPVPPESPIEATAPPSPSPAGEGDATGGASSPSRANAPTTASPASPAGPRVILVSLRMGNFNDPFPGDPMTLEVRVVVEEDLAETAFLQILEGEAPIAAVPIEAGPRGEREVHHPLPAPAAGDHVYTLLEPASGARVEAKFQVATMRVIELSVGDPPVGDGGTIATRATLTFAPGHDEPRTLEYLVDGERVALRSINPGEGAVELAIPAGAVGRHSLSITFVGGRPPFGPVEYEVLPA